MLEKTFLKFNISSAIEIITNEKGGLNERKLRRGNRAFVHGSDEVGWYPAGPHGLMLHNGCVSEPLHSTRSSLSLWITCSGKWSHLVLLA